MLKIIYTKIYRQLAIIKNNILRDYYLYFNKSKNKEILIYCGTTSLFSLCYFLNQNGARVILLALVLWNLKCLAIID